MTNLFPYMGDSAVCRVMPIFGTLMPRHLHTRIAPTPSGNLHAGNVFSFLLTATLVKKYGGTLRLRIDDLDAPRVEDRYLDHIFETLAWLGIRWDEGPQNREEHLARYSQQHRLPLYHRLIERLIDTGKVFACTCSRKETGGRYPGTCRNKALPLDTENAALRINTGDECMIAVHDLLAGTVAVNLDLHMKDFVIRRRDGIPAYQVASLADDLDYGINCIVRGTDLLPSTAAQLFLAGLLGERSFAQSAFLHHALLLDEKGEKLSKSKGSEAFERSDELKRQLEEKAQAIAGSLLIC